MARVCVSRQDELFEEMYDYRGHWQKQLAKLNFPPISDRRAAEIASFGEWTPEEQVAMTQLPKKVCGPLTHAR